jgi:hypothetical protein
VVLLDNVIQVFTLSQQATSPEGAVLLQFFDRHRIGTILIDVDHPRHQITGMCQCAAKEALRRCRVTLGRQQKIDVCPVESTARYKNRS